MPVVGLGVGFLQQVVGVVARLMLPLAERLGLGITIDLSAALRLGDRDLDVWITRGSRFTCTASPADASVST